MLSPPLGIAKRFVRVCNHPEAMLCNLLLLRRRSGPLVWVPLRRQLAVLAREITLRRRHPHAKHLVAPRQVAGVCATWGALPSGAAGSPNAATERRLGSRLLRLDNTGPLCRRVSAGAGAADAFGAHLWIQDACRTNIEEAALQIASRTVHACTLTQRIDVAGIERNRCVEVCKRRGIVTQGLVRFRAPTENPCLSETGEDARHKQFHEERSARTCMCVPSTGAMASTVLYAATALSALAFAAAASPAATAACNDTEASDAHV
jgi:hypothetical protein